MFRKGRGRFENRKSAYDGFAVKYNRKGGGNKKKTLNKTTFLVRFGSRIVRGEDRTDVDVTGEKTNVSHTSHRSPCMYIIESVRGRRGEVHGIKRIRTRARGRT